MCNEIQNIRCTFILITHANFSMKQNISRMKINNINLLQGKRIPKSTKIPNICAQFICPIHANSVALQVLLPKLYSSVFEKHTLILMWIIYGLNFRIVIKYENAVLIIWKFKCRKLAYIRHSHPIWYLFRCFPFTCNVPKAGQFSWLLSVG